MKSINENWFDADKRTTDPVTRQGVGNMSVQAMESLAGVRKPESSIARRQVEAFTKFWNQVFDAVEREEIV